MRGRLMTAALAIVAAMSFTTEDAAAGDPLAMYQVWSYNAQMNRPWHGGYYHINYGQPLALVAPPTASMRQTLSWGVSQNLMYPVPHQFGRSANSPGAAGPGQFAPTPHWPSHTDQFGVYYVRGPWR